MIGNADRKAVSGGVGAGRRRLPRVEWAAIPVTILGGYLGAGKTTLVNHLLRQSGPRRLAVILNDFGSVDLDRPLIASRGSAAVNLAKGCICCGRETEFVLALAGLSSRPWPPDHVLVEASWVSDLLRIAECADLRGLRIDGTVVVADAGAVRSHAADPVIGARVCRQLAAADLVVLNKTDLVTDREKIVVHDWILELAPSARLVEASQGRVPLPLVIDRGLATAAAPPMVNDAELAPPKSEDTSEEPHYASWSWSRDEPLDEGAFRWWVSLLPEGVLRGSGVLHLEGDPAHRYLFHLVGSRWSLERNLSWGDEHPASRLLLVGRSDSLDQPCLSMMIARCLARPDYARA